MDIVVTSKRKGSAPAPMGYTIVNVARPSILGNPFPMESEADRAKVIAEFEDWLRKEWKKNGAVRRELEALAERARNGEKLALQCWCSPKACHADVIKRAIEGINRRYYEQQAQGLQAP